MNSESFLHIERARIDPRRSGDNPGDTMIYPKSLGQRLVRDIHAYCRDHNIEVILTPSKVVHTHDKETCKGFFLEPSTYNNARIVVSCRLNRTIFYHTLTHEFVHALQYLHAKRSDWNFWMKDKNYIQLETMTEKRTLEILDHYGILTPCMIKNSRAYLKGLNTGVLHEEYSNEKWE